MGKEGTTTIPLVSGTHESDSKSERMPLLDRPDRALQPRKKLGIEYIDAAGEFGEFHSNGSGLDWVQTPIT